VNITSQMVKELRDKTNAGMMDCKRVLTETNGDLEASIKLLRERGIAKAGAKADRDLLRQKGLAVAAKRAGRETKEGLVESYIHAGGKLGVMVEVGCETDFVAKTDDFKTFVKDVAMHIAAVNPIAVSREEVPAEILQREKDIYINQALESGKPQQIVEKMVGGKVEKYLAEICLLEQKFVKNPDLSVQDLLNELIAKMGENISIKQFARFQIG
jgi:elongation factor Ts